MSIAHWFRARRQIQIQKVAKMVIFATSRLLGRKRELPRRLSDSLPPPLLASRQMRLNHFTIKLNSKPSLIGQRKITIFKQQPVAQHNLIHPIAFAQHRLCRRKVSHHTLIRQNRSESDGLTNHVALSLLWLLVLTVGAFAAPHIALAQRFININVVDFARFD
jgi:hypothetical protein